MHITIHGPIFFVFFCLSVHVISTTTTALRCPIMWVQRFDADMQQGIRRRWWQQFHSEGSFWRAPSVHNTYTVFLNGPFPPSCWFIFFFLNQTTIVHTYLVSSAYLLIIKVSLVINYSTRYSIKLYLCRYNKEWPETLQWIFSPMTHSNDK